MAELVDARDLKSLGPSGCAGSIPAPGTIYLYDFFDDYLLSAWVQAAFPNADVSTKAGVVMC